MINLINTEWLKIRKYKGFWWMLGITALSYPGVNYFAHEGYQSLMRKKDMSSSMVKMIVGNPFTFPEAWHTVAYMSSFFVFIPAIVIIMFITNEYTYKTHRQNIIDGWSRKEFMIAKLIDVVLITLLVTLLYSLVALTIGFINAETYTASPWEGSKYVALFALQTFAQLSLAFLVAFIARKAFVGLGIFIFYLLILEPITVAIARNKAADIGRFMPLEISDRLIPPPAFAGKFNQEWYKAALAAIDYHIIYTIVLLAIIWGLCFWLNSKRDL